MSDAFPPLLAWDGVIFVHKGMYAKGTFKFRLLIPPTYPDTAVPVRAPRAACCASKLAGRTKQENNVLLAVRRSHIHSPPLPILPRQRIFFQTHVFHPRVDSTTLELDLSNQYQEWAPRTDRLWHLLKYIYHIFYNIDVENARNTKAAALCVRLLKRALACGARCALGPYPPNRAHSARLPSSSPSLFCRYTKDEDAFRQAAAKCAAASNAADQSRTGTRCVPLLRGLAGRAALRPRASFPPR